MLKFIRKTLLVLVIVLLSLLLIVLAVGYGLYKSADICEPDVEIDLESYPLSVDTDSVRICGDNSLFLNRYGLWEARLTGNAIDRGAAYGKMSRDLLEYQEDVFVRQIYEIVSSDWWVEFLHKVIVIFNRNMASYIPIEYREEIYAMSKSCTDAYDSYGPPYGRQLNYHAAHDIGHAMQEYMLVGCSSFAVWGSESVTSGLVVGRNFDFYVGDDFARNKIVLFIEPSVGYDFVSVTWPGMMGVLSGMNEKGLTVTINAAKGSLPVSSAMPVSLLARHILQNASDIEEAYSIAKEFRTFVSESILIGSAADGYAAVIEKTPEKTSIYCSGTERLVCTNHYQSDAFRDDKYNIENILRSDSRYRFDRINELLDSLVPVGREEAAMILRNRYGRNNADIGLSNEKSVNQFISHHSVIFYPDSLKMWVSSSPWQLGKYICYDLNEIFGNRNFGGASLSSEKDIIFEDSIAMRNDYPDVCRYRQMYRQCRNAADSGVALPDWFVGEFIAVNPGYFQTYDVLGDYMMSVKQTSAALQYWRKALECEIPRLGEKEQIEAKIREGERRGN